MTDTLSRVEDAVATALVSIYGGSLGATIYKGFDGDEMSLPAIVVAAESESPTADGIRTACGLSTEVVCSVSVISNAADSMRSDHGAIAYAVEAVVKRSVDQMTTACNAAAITGLTVQDVNYSGASHSYEDQRRTSSFSVTLTVHAI